MAVPKAWITKSCSQVQHNPKRKRGESFGKKPRSPKGAAASLFGGVKSRRGLRFGSRRSSQNLAEYLSAGSEEVWLIDHENREVHVRTADGERLLREGKTLESGLLPGFHVSVGDLLSV